MRKTLAATDFTRLFGADEPLPQLCQDLISQHNWSYRVLQGDEHAVVLAQNMDEAQSTSLAPAGRVGRRHWYKVWAESLATFHDTESLEALVPPYKDRYRPLRLDGEYIMPEDPQFERHWHEVYLRWIFLTYPLNDVLYEFGCGSGFNLMILASLSGNQRLVGLDWSESAVRLIDELNGHIGGTKKLQGIYFDFFAPNISIRLNPSSTIFTLHALEQTGRRWEHFMQYLRDQKPALCVHIEPILEWYDPEDPFDQVAMAYHQKRRYWVGFPDYLKQLEQEGKAEIIKMRRVLFGSRHIDSYSQIIWRPLGSRT